MGKDLHGLAVRFHHEGELRLAASVVTIGAFDGVHLGHQELILQTILTANERDLPAVVYTFDPPPKVYFGQAAALIPLREKLDRTAAFVPQHIIVARFGRKYASRTAADFVAELKNLNPRQILVGEDFRFGSCKSGNTTLLRQYFDVRDVAAERCCDGEVGSSSRIRSLRRSGFFAAAAALEGWNGALLPPGAHACQLTSVPVVNQ